MMDEQRFSQYVELIQALLGCPDGEEMNILNANLELVDLGLVEVMGQYAEYIRAQGQGNVADFLTNMVGRINAFLNNNKLKEFCTDILQAEITGGRNAVLSKLTQNLSLVNQELGSSLIQIASRLIYGKNAKHQNSITEKICNIYNYLLEFSLGDIKNNLISAIAGYQYLLDLNTNGSEGYLTLNQVLGFAYHKLASYSNPK